MNAMERLRLVGHRRGGRSKDKPSGWAARYWPDTHLLRAAVAHGITAANVRDAFRYQSAKVGKPPRVKHDGIIVPASAEGRACELLREAGEAVAGVGLRLKVDRSQECLGPA